MNAIQNTYINALLADACYVDLTIGMNTNEIISATKDRLTSTASIAIAVDQMESSDKATFCFETEATSDGWMWRAA